MGICQRCKYGLVPVLLLGFILSLGYPPGETRGARIKDITEIKGARENQLVGYGLVVGLNGTGDGDDTKFTFQSLASMLEKMGMTVDPKDIEDVANVAAVMVTADLPPFARRGSRLDVLVSSIGDADSLEGGTLVMTPLKGADGSVYAVAQGPISTGGFSVQGGGASVAKNFPTVGRVVGGGLIEKEVCSDFALQNTVTLALHQPDFTNASRIVQVINQRFPEPLARTVDAGTVNIRVPSAYQGALVEFITAIEKLELVPDAKARVVVNERTGTVVMGADVKIMTIAVAHGNLSIQIKESADVSQPLPFSQGQTVVAPDTTIEVEEESTPVFLVKGGTSIGQLVRALNALGVTPRDLIAIFQAIKAAGALQAELEII